jgi:hypothetical protein
MQKAGRGALLARATSPAPRCPDAPEPPEPPAAPGPIACSRQSPPDRLLLTCRSGNRGPIARPRGSGSARRGIERPLHCTHCGLALINAKPLPASSSVMALQKLLLTGKRQGKMQLNGLGCLNWSDMVALADVLFDMWTVAGIPDRYFLLQQQEFQDADHPNHRYGNLALLAALLRGWPYTASRLRFSNTSSRNHSHERSRRCIRRNGVRVPRFRENPGIGRCAAGYSVGCWESRPARFAGGQSPGLIRQLSTN